MENYKMRSRAAVAAGIVIGSFGLTCMLLSVFIGILFSICGWDYSMCVLWLFSVLPQNYYWLIYSILSFIPLGILLILYGIKRIPS